jgi:iron complex transport system ATP-binding protein
MSDLRVNDLTCGYGSRRVLEQVSLAAQAGEVLALLGPNGAGKTTLIRALSRLLRPEAGEVTLFGDDLWSQPASAAAKRIALAPQSESRDWPLTIAEAVRLGRAAHRGWLMPFNRDDEAAVDRALAQTGLADLRERPIDELSGGEWRRAVLARALAQETSVLLLDEPTGGLDLKYQIEILSLVRHLAVREKLIVVLTLHDLNVAALFADRVALLCDRRLEAIGSPVEVITAERIGRVYGIAVDVVPHPVYGLPLVAPRQCIHHAPRDDSSRGA